MKTIHHPTVSWQTLTQAAAKRRQTKPLNGADDASITGRDSWAGGSLDEAVDKMMFGWPAGVRQIESLCAVETYGADGRTWMAEVSGYFPLVPAYLAGQPDRMMVEQPTESQLQRVALFLPVSYQSRVKAATALTCAGAVAQLVAEMLASGIDCAVFGYDATKGTGKKHNTVVTTYAVRAFGDPVDLSKIAFATHPSFLRRVLFAFYETSETHSANGLASDNYGACAEVTEADLTKSLGWDAGPVIVPRLGMDNKLDAACQRGDVTAALAFLRGLLKVHTHGVTS